MRNQWLLAAACMGAAGATAIAAGQTAHPPAPGSGQATHVCACGAHPPGPPPVRTVEPYANEPQDMSPYARFVTPYSRNYTQPTFWTGPGRNSPDPKGLTEVHIGFVGPVQPQDPDHVFGQRMLHGAQLATEEANARGGYGGKPFRLMIHDDYSNWQEGAVSGSDRPTDPAIWGSSSDVAVKMI